ncbi:hypothetical protein AS889_09665 [Pseudomonas putida]|nr:hypothetical protein AS889_09665 [Pseudomonas putida]
MNSRTRLGKPRTALFGSGHGLASFDLAQHFQHVLTRHLNNRQVTQPRQDALGEVPFDLGIAPLSDQIPCLVAGFTIVLEADCRVDAHRKAGLLAQPVETRVPLLGALRTDEQCKASGVFEGVVLAGGLRLANSGVGQWHVYI